MDRSPEGGSRKSDVNRPSSLLSDQENNEIYQLIGRRSITLSTTVAQVFQCLPRQSHWQKFCIGVVCFVKDNARKSYFISVVNFAKKSIEWEQEIYNNFGYNAKTSNFHSFEADEFVAGLNFASQDEANHFRSAIEDKLKVKQQRKMERRQTTVKRDATRNTRSSNSAQVLQPIQSNQISPPPSISPSPSLTSLTETKNKKNKQQKGGKKGKITKDDIGTPSDFRHVGHVGWDPKGGFDVDNIDPQWKKLFDTIGVTEGQLQDEETSQFIYDFVEQHGGIEKATKELEKSVATPPPPPARSAPGPPPSRAPPPRGPAPPPPPGQRMPQPSRSPPAPPPQPGRSAPRPPPPPSRHGGAPPPPTSAPRAPPPSRQTPSRAGPPPPPSNVPMPPPAPPPPPMAPPPPAIVLGGPPAPPPPMGVGAPPPPSSGGAAGGEAKRGGLLDEIHSGMQLKKVTENPQKVGAGGGGRGDLLDEIRGGSKLKSVSDDDRQSGNPSELDGMAGALAKALAQRGKHIQVEDDEDDDEEDDDFDDDDWSD